MTNTLYSTGRDLIWRKIGDTTEGGAFYVGEMSDYYSDANDEELDELETRDEYGFTPEEHLAAYRRSRNINPDRGGLLIHHTADGGAAVATQISGSNERPDEMTELTEAEKELDRARRRVDVLGKLAALSDDAVICWTRSFREDQPAYSYVALKAGGYWYTTEQGVHRCSARTLVEKLIYADEGSLLTVMEWSPLTD